MKKSGIILALALAVLLITSCNQGKENQNPRKPDLINKQNLTLNKDLMTPEALWAFGRISDIQVSPDQSKILFGISYYDIELNKGNRELYSINSDGSEFKQLTKTPYSEFNAIWRPDGKKIGYLSSESGSIQLWEMDPDGAGKKMLTNIDNGITGFKYSPDQSMILYTKELFIKNPYDELYEGLPKATGRLNNDLMYRHWDHWVDTYSHVFYANYNEKNITEGTDIMHDEPYESPLSPFGGIEQITWTPDSKGIAYTCKKKSGLEYSKSTNSDIYLYNISTGKTQNLTKGMMGFDIGPSFSADGTKLAWESMERDGYESDKNRLFVLDLNTGEKTYYTKDFDQNVNGFSWSSNGEAIYFISPWHGTKQIYRLDLADNSIDKISEGIHNYISLSYTDAGLIAARQSMSMPTEIFIVNLQNGSSNQITRVNKDLLDQITMGKIEKRWIKTTDNKNMLTWVIYPPHFDPDKKYPALLYCQGGPQSMVSQFWSYRWNFQMMAANGYIIVAPNRRGLPGFGQEWLEQISGDYGGQNMRDYLSAIDALAKEPFIDKERLGAVGASYGGFSVFWLAGNHDKRFKAFIAHDGMFNFEAQYLETEEMWFVDWDLGGAFWEFDNKTAMRSYSNSPHKFVHKWDTPILVIHGELDYRITYTQGMSAFNAAILRGIPAEFLYFPDENHWVLTPQNGILWQRTFFNWLDTWLKE